MRANMVLTLTLTVAGLAIGSAARAATPDALLSAYKKEFAFLEAEKHALSKRATELEKNHLARANAAKGDIGALEARLLHLRSQADDLETALEDLAREATKSEERGDILNDTADRARSTLESAGLDLPAVQGESGAAAGADLKTLFERAGNLIRSSARVQRSEGAFFLPDGTEAKGTVVRVGRVAAYGVTPQHSGALVPVGGGRMRIFKEPAAGTATALSADERPDTLRIFLYESMDKAIQEKAVKTALSIVESGGIIAWVIVALGGLGLLLIGLRALILMGAGATNTKLLDRVGDLVLRDQIPQATKLCHQTGGALTRVLRTTLKNLHRDRTTLDDVVSEALMTETPKLDRFASTILVIAAVAPLLGLLGTVTGMISTFDVITEFGTGDPKLLSGGISEALVTTELGLIVAIPALLLGTLLSGYGESIKAGLERSALRVINLARGAETAMTSRPAPAKHDADGLRPAPIAPEAM